MLTRVPKGKVLKKYTKQFKNVLYEPIAVSHRHGKTIWVCARLKIEEVEKL